MSEDLARRVEERIRREGPITFAEFMESALYDADGGYYEGAPIGSDGDYLTSPHVSPAFGALLARQLAECWELLDRPRPFVVVELGAGQGILARQVLHEAGSVERFAEHLRYVAVERSRAARRALEKAGVEAAASLGEVAGASVVLANEVLDNLPFHRLRERKGRIVEVMVGLKDGRLIETEEEPTQEALGALTRPLLPGDERPVSPAALALVDEIAEALSRGYAFFFDYGFDHGEAAGEVQAYLRHLVSPDVLEQPGTRDITTAVDLGAVAERGRANGLTVWQPVSQRDALLGLGFRLWMQAARRREAEATARGDHRAAARLFAARSRASILIDETKLGSLKLLVLGTEGVAAPAAALGDRETGC